MREPDTSTFALNDRKRFAKATTMQHFNTNGYELIPDFLDRGTLNALLADLQNISLKAQRGGIRNAEKKFPVIADLVRSAGVLEKARRYLPGDPRVVRVILFDKTAQNNWMVPWHQDRTVAVSQRTRIDGWGPWSVKDGTPHVQPPVEVLDAMVTFRIHLDTMTPTNGGLRVIPGSHRRGLLDAAQIAQQAGDAPIVALEAPVGSALVMRPHLLHASGKAATPASRRILHVEYSGFSLPSGLRYEGEAP